MRKRLVDDVSITELLEMRESGLTNREIAARLDCSYQTVLRYIGHADFRKKRQASSKIETAPVVHGCWQLIEQEKVFGMCSSCGRLGVLWWRYCPDCGTKMDMKSDTEAEV
jgi:hypothetical protein